MISKDKEIRFPCENFIKYLIDDTHINLLKCDTQMRINAFSQFLHHYKLYCENIEIVGILDLIFF